MIFVARPIVNAMFKGDIHPTTKDIIHELVSDSAIGHTKIGPMLDDLEREIRRSSEILYSVGDVEVPFAKICNVMYIIDCPDITPRINYPTTIRLAINVEFIHDDGGATCCPGVICEFTPPYRNMSEYYPSIMENINDYTEAYNSNVLAKAAQFIPLGRMLREHRLH